MPISPKKVESDVLIIGAGVAGLSLALYLSSDYKVNIISKSSPENSSTYRAQGGIACVTAMEDTYEEHIEDTIVAGAGLCDKKIVEMVVKNGPQVIEDIKHWGVVFSGGNENPSLGREGGHSQRRILHKEDRTGEELSKKLLKKVEEAKNINIFWDHTAVNLILKSDTCAGVYALDNTKTEVKTFISKITVLATGGCGKVYLYTSNPDAATGDGVAMAYRMGAKIANMEFIQFHPTNLYSNIDKNFLITEAMRGEGAVLLNSEKEKFMQNYHELEDLAPRDIVARAIDSEMKRSGSKHVYLDIHSYREKDFIKKRFPSIFTKLNNLGIDITQENIPVVPAAHYCCGGIDVDDSGFTSVKSLMALGECSNTGLHGANRLASNSLLEALIFSKRAANSLNKMLDKISLKTVELWEYTGNRLPEEQVFVEHNWLELRRIMWNYVGVVRSNYRLAEALKRLDIIKKEVDYHYWNYLITPSLIELRNLVDVAEIIIRSAMLRKESRGLHYNVDFPSLAEGKALNTFMCKT